MPIDTLDSVSVMILAPPDSCDLLPTIGHMPSKSHAISSHVTKMHVSNNLSKETSV